MPNDYSDPQGRRARIDRMIAVYRKSKQRRLMRRAIRLWRKAERHQQLVRLDAQPDLVH